MGAYRAPACFELIAAILLLAPRTVTIGAPFRWA
jgi:hypothetical protein